MVNVTLALGAQRSWIVCTDESAHCCGLKTGANAKADGWTFDEP